MITGIINGTEIWKLANCDYKTYVVCAHGPHLHRRPQILYVLLAKTALYKSYKK